MPSVPGLKYSLLSLDPGVRSPSVYILLLLVDEESFFSQWLSRIVQGRSSKQIDKERVGSQ